MRRSIKARLYPGSDQRIYLGKQFGCCRFVYNESLKYSSESYENGIKVSNIDRINRLVDLKKQYPFLKEVNSKVLQQSVRNLNAAFTNFFRGTTQYPVTKKRRNEQSSRFPSDAFIGVKGNRVSLVKELRNILFRCSRGDEIFINRYQDKIASVTVKMSVAGEYFIIFCFGEDVPLKNNKSLKDTDDCIGIDLGVKTFIVTSEGEIFENKHFHKSDLKKLKRQQRRLARKQKGSKNRNKARVQLAKTYRDITNKKKDYLQKVSSRLINENQVICMEDLNVTGMMKNHKLAQSIQEANMGEFRRMLEYKAKWYNRKLVFVDRFYPSSKTCNHCGYIKKDLTLKDRTWICPQCGQIIDRDYNAARNILDEGLRILQQG